MRNVILAFFICLSLPNTATADCRTLLSPSLLFHPITFAGAKTFHFGSIWTPQQAHSVREKIILTPAGLKRTQTPSATFDQQVGLWSLRVHRDSGFFMDQEGLKSIDLSSLPLSRPIVESLRSYLHSIAREYAGWATSRADLTIYFVTEAFQENHSHGKTREIIYLKQELGEFIEVRSDSSSERPNPETPFRKLTQDSVLVLGDAWHRSDRTSVQRRQKQLGVIVIFSQTLALKNEEN